MKNPLQILLCVTGIGFCFSTYGQEITTYDTITTKEKNNLTPLVSAMNMNVLYRGLDNPIEISVPGKYDQIMVECSGGKMTGEGGKYVIKPGSEKKVIVSVYTITNGKAQDTSCFQFRVKLVPTPEITWCNKKTGETVRKECIGGFTYQNTCGSSGGSPLIPRMEDFDFDVYATIQSFDIAYTMDGKLVEKIENKGNQIPKDVATDLKSLPSGTQVFFTNVKIICPGGDTRISSATYTIE